MTITLLLVYYIEETTEHKINIKKFIKDILVVLSGMIAYYIGLKVGMIIFHRSLANYKGANELGLSTIINMPRNIISC